MKNTITIEIPKGMTHIEIRNKITKFFDQYSISFTGDKFNEWHSTYISLFDFDINDLLLNRYEPILAFRIVGATRGGIHLKEVKREGQYASGEMIYSIHYIITEIEFIESTCFESFKVYSRDIIEDSKRELLGKDIIINIHK